MTSIIIGHTSMLGSALISQLDQIGESYMTAGRAADSDIHIDLTIQPPALPESCMSIAGIERIYILASSFEGDSASGANMNLLVNSASAAYAILLADTLKPQSLIYSGSASSYDEFDIRRGLSSYGLTKRIAEELLAWWAKQSKIRFASIRFSQLFDDNGMCIAHQPWIGRIVRYAFEKRPLYMPQSGGKRNFLHVQDAARLLLEVSRNTYLSGILNGCSPHQYSYEDLAHIAFTFNECIDSLHISNEKQPFRPICLPRDKPLYEVLNQEPMITPARWIEQIAALKSWPCFGPMDVQES
jgi:nucleoside-diphosphate-sugar epimerase